MRRTIEVFTGIIDSRSSQTKQCILYKINVDERKNLSLLSLLCSRTPVSSIHERSTIVFYHWKSKSRSRSFRFSLFFIDVGCICDEHLLIIEW